MDGGDGGAGGCAVGVEAVGPLVFGDGAEAREVDGVGGSATVEEQDAPVGAGAGGRGRGRGLPLRLLVGAVEHKLGEGWREEAGARKLARGASSRAVTACRPCSTAAAHRRRWYCPAYASRSSSVLPASSARAAPTDMARTAARNRRSFVFAARRTSSARRWLLSSSSMRCTRALRALSSALSSASASRRFCSNATALNTDPPDTPDMPSR